MKQGSFVDPDDEGNVELTDAEEFAKANKAPLLP